MEAILNKLMSILRFQSTKTNDPKTGSMSKWIPTIIGILTALIGSAVAYYLMWKKGKELAKLKHEKDVNEEKKRQEEENKVILKEEEKVAESQKKIEALKEEITKVDERIEKVRETNTTIRERLKNVQDWRSLDSVINRSDT